MVRRVRKIENRRENRWVMLSAQFEATARDCMETPGIWKRFPSSDKNPSQPAWRVNNGKIDDFLPEHGFEARVVDRVPYVRYVPENDSRVGK